MDLEPIDGSGAPGAQLAAFHSYRGWFVAAGAALVALGALAIVLPLIFTLAFDIAIGVVLVGSGAVHAVHAMEVRRWRGAIPRLVVALIYVVAGVLILVNPLTGALALTLILSAFLVAAGVSRLILASHLHGHPGWGWTLASGILSLLLGVLIFLGWPSTAVWVLGLYVGVDLLFAGWSLLGLTVLPRLSVPR
jgi:uncharacterized membrane protein HdeD (DUF308 family)